MTFLSKLVYSKVGKVKHELTKPLLYTTKILPSSIKTAEEFLITVPVGFPTDGASIPRLVWTLVGSRFSGLHVEPAVIHDFLYAIHLYSRKKADLIFLEALKSCGVSLWKRQIIYRAVRIAGHWAYHRHDNDVENVGN